ncbi:MAG: GNAT family N-acetyltransferase [Rikenellaceae bacterium]
MIEFHPITLEDRALIESYTHDSEIRNCDLSFANMYCWQPTYKSAWAVVEGYLVIRFYIDGGEKIGYMQPIGDGGCQDFTCIIPELAQDAHSHGDRLRIIGITERGRDSIMALGIESFAFHSDPCFEDYIYLRESLATLSGKRLQPKRNHINQLLKRYPNYEYRPLTPTDYEACLALDCRWRRERGECCKEMTAERIAILRAFDNFEALDLRGGVLYIDGELRAFTYGSAINGDTFCTHIEKADSSINGCYSIINRLFAESLPPHFRYVNREEDLGIEGLRRAKLSYYPDHKQRKYTAIYIHHDESECRRLWQSVFCDEELFIDEFIINHYSQHRMLRVTDRDNRYLSMLHIIPFESEVGRVAYIYGVATHPDFRGRGYSSQLMAKAMEMIRRDGFAVAALIPSEEWLKSYYAKFGFEEGGMITFESYNNFDFGQGDPSLDRGMVCVIAEALNIDRDKPLHLSR